MIIHTYTCAYALTRTDTYCCILIHIYAYAHLLIYDYMYLYILVHTCTHLYKLIHTYTYLYKLIHTYTYLYKLRYTYACSYILIHTRTYTYLYIRVQTYTYLYIVIHTYTYTHTYVLVYLYTYILKHLVVSGHGARRMPRHSCAPPGAAAPRVAMLGARGRRVLTVVLAVVALPGAGAARRSEPDAFGKELQALEASVRRTPGILKARIADAELVMLRLRDLAYSPGVRGASRQHLFRMAALATDVLDDRPPDFLAFEPLRAQEHVALQTLFAIARHHAASEDLLCAIVRAMSVAARLPDEVTMLELLDVHRILAQRPGTSDQLLGLLLSNCELALAHRESAGHCRAIAPRVRDTVASVPKERARANPEVWRAMVDALAPIVQCRGGMSLMLVLGGVQLEGCADAEMVDSVARFLIELIDMTEARLSHSAAGAAVQILVYIAEHANTTAASMHAVLDCVGRCASATDWMEEPIFVGLRSVMRRILERHPGREDIFARVVANVDLFSRSFGEDAEPREVEALAKFASALSERAFSVAARAPSPAAERLALRSFRTVVSLPSWTSPWRNFGDASIYDRCPVALSLLARSSASLMESARHVLGHWQLPEGVFYTVARFIIEDVDWVDGCARLGNDRGVVRALLHAACAPVFVGEVAVAGFVRAVRMQADLVPALLVRQAWTPVLEDGDLQHLADCLAAQPMGMDWGHADVQRALALLDAFRSVAPPSLALCGSIAWVFALSGEDHMSRLSAACGDEVLALVA